MLRHVVSLIISYGHLDGFINYQLFILHAAGVLPHANLLSIRSFTTCSTDNLFSIFPQLFRCVLLSRSSRINGTSWKSPGPDSSNKRLRFPSSSFFVLASTVSFWIPRVPPSFSSEAHFVRHTSAVAPSVNVALQIYVTCHASTGIPVS